MLFRSVSQSRYDELQRFYSKINQKELIVCCLIKLSFNNSQIANIFNQTQSAISNLRKRLYRKMFNKDECFYKLDIISQCEDIEVYEWLDDKDTTEIKSDVICYC